MEDMPIVLSGEEAASLQNEAKRLADLVDTSYFELGDVLTKIAKSGCYREWINPATKTYFETMNEYIEGDIGFARRKAYYLMSIREKADELGLVVEDLRGVGWSKAKEILPISASKAEFDTWAGKARDLSLADLIREVKVAKGADPATGKDADGNPLAISTDGEALHIVQFRLYDDQYANFQTAMQLARTVAESEPGADEVPSHLMDMICLDFAAHNGSISDMSAKLVDWFVQAGGEEFQQRLAAAINAKMVDMEEDEEDEAPPTEPAE